MIFLELYLLLSSELIKEKQRRRKKRKRSRNKTFNDG